MSGGWEVGDLALCVDASEMGCGARGGAALDEGRAYRVIGVIGPRLWADFEFCCGLCVEGVVNAANPLDDSFSERRFRKIRPDEHEGNADDWNLLTEQFGAKVKA